MSELKKQTVSGVKWLVGSSFLQKAIQTGATIVLARILGPSQFGLFALAFVAIDGLSLFKSMGFDSALIQRKDNIEKAANTAFFIIPALGIVLYLILAISAPLIGKFLNSQEVVGVIRALGIIFVISCLGKVPTALLEKNMKFRQVSIIEIGTAVVYAVSAVTFGLLKFGVWSLVYAYILKTLYQNVLSYVYAKWRPRVEFDRKIAIEMFHFGKYMFLTGIVWFLKTNLANLLVGKLLGIAALGLYAIAFNIGNFGVAYFAAKVHRVVFPAFSKIQNDLYDLKKAMLRTFKYVSIIAIPLGVGLLMLSPDLLRTVYGEKWVGAASALRFLAIAGIFNTLPISFATIFLVLKRPKLWFWSNAIQVILFFLLIAPAADMFGIEGVSAVVAISSIVAFLFSLNWAIKLLPIKIIEIFISLKPAIIASVIMALGIALAKNFRLHDQSGFIVYYNFALLVIFSFLIYSYSIFKMERAISAEIKEMVSI